jgi:hypothetical protein
MASQKRSVDSVAPANTAAAGRQGESQTGCVKIDRYPAKASNPLAHALGHLIMVHRTQRYKQTCLRIDLLLSGSSPEVLGRTPTVIRLLLSAGNAAITTKGTNKNIISNIAFPYLKCWVARPL